MKSIIYNHPESNTNKNNGNKSPNPFFLALLLTGILACEAYPNLTETAVAAVRVMKSPQLEANNKSNLKANKFASLLKSVQNTNKEFGQEISQPYSLPDQTFNQILTISQPGINEKPYEIKKLRKSTPNIKFEKIAENIADLPNDIADAVRQNLAAQIGISPDKIEVSKASQETWPNTCLGLPKSDELCGQMLVEGWRIVLSNGSDTWIYRTDSKGQLLRIEPQDSSEDR
ncbi:MAG: hypothetical protein WBA93_13285 [Microcoleaceae cyanobacterium]